MKDINSRNIKRLQEIISEAEKPVIVTHMKPDGDAMGSSLALYHLIVSMGKKAKIILNDNWPSYLGFLIEKAAQEDICIYQNDAASATAAISGSDLIFCLDFNAFHRTDNLEASLNASKAKKILIDHHLNPERSCFDLSFSETEISSASELLYQIMMALPAISGNAAALPDATAEALMTGMTTDTNNFANSVYPSTLRMASALLEAGVDRDGILMNLYNRHSENRLRLMGLMMKDLLKITDDDVAYIVLDRKTQEAYEVAEGDTEGFVNMPLSIEKVRMSLLLKEDEDRVRVSIRSKRGTSANMCAKLHFNGGGHENAAGGRLRIPEDIAGIEEAAAYIERHTHIYLNENEDNN